MAVHAILAGPARDPYRVRVVHHGAAEATRHGLLMKLNDGRQARVVLDDHVALAELAAELLGQVPAVECGTDLLKALRTITRWVQNKRRGPDDDLATAADVLAQD